MRGPIRRILLVSAEKGYADLLKKLLHNTDGNEFEIIQVFPLEKVLGEINSGDYDLVILDIPAGDNCAVASEKVCQISSQLPIVVLSQSRDQFAVRAIRNGAQQVIDKKNLDNYLLSQTIITAIDRKRIENEIHMRDEILQAVNNAAEIFLTQSNWEAYLHDVLANLGKATRSDRVYIIKNAEDSPDGMTARIQDEWVAEGVQPEKQITVKDGIDLKKEGFQHWVRILKEGNVIHGDVESLPAKEQPFLMKLGIKSFAYVPIFFDHTLWGFIGFDQCSVKNDWSQVEIDALKTAANIFGAAISRQLADEKLTYLATHDYLTDMPNRLLFEDRFYQAVARSERSNEKFAIVSLDMDKFKVVNDTHGHPIGDQVLIEVSRRLEKAIRGSDTCARIGGDEFAVIAEGIHNKGDVIRVMQKISNILQPKMVIEGRNIEVSASMGASIYPSHGTTMEELFRFADKALYMVKDNGSKFRVFSDEQISWLKD